MLEKFRIISFLSNIDNKVPDEIPGEREFPESVRNGTPPPQIPDLNIPPGVDYPAVAIGLISSIVASNLPFPSDGNLFTEAIQYVSASALSAIFLSALYHTFIGIFLKRPPPRLSNVLEGWVNGSIGGAIKSFILPSEAHWSGILAAYALPNLLMYVTRWKDK